MPIAEDVDTATDEIVLAVTVGEVDYQPVTYASLKEAVEHLTDCWLADMEAGCEDEVIIKFTSHKMKRSELAALPEWDGP